MSPQKIKIPSMKNILIIFSLFCSVHLFAQCPEDGPIFFTSQAELDAFGQSYPGCTEINGEVFIMGPDINNLSSFKNIEKIEGDFNIVNCESLVSLEGLEKLSKSSILSIGNVNIKDLKPLNSLIITGGLRIVSCANLESFDGLQNLREAPEVMRITDNPRLKNMDAIENIESVFGIWINNNDSLKTLPNFHKLDKVSTEGNTINFITNNDNLISLNGLDSIKYCAIFEIKRNPRLKSLEGLQNLKAARDWLDISENDSLVSLSGLEGIDGVFENSSTIHGDIYINDNPELVDLNGLVNLQQMEGNLIIEGNSKLIDIEALQNLDSVLRDIVIQDNASLTSLSGLDNLDYSLFNSLSISNCENLSFCSVRSVCLGIENNANITIELNDEGCNSTAEVTEICLTSNEDITFGNLSLYPNPVTSYLYINNENNYPIQAIQVYNALGEKINLPILDDQIDFTSQPTGIYFVSVILNNRKQSYKVFKS